MALTVKLCGKTTKHPPHPFTSTEDHKRYQCSGEAKVYKNIVPGQKEKKPLKKDPLAGQARTRRSATAGKTPTKCPLTTVHPAHTFKGINCPGVKPRRKKPKSGK